jgi:ribosomal protein S18 acetylase RimI-like enzyme
MEHDVENLERATLAAVPPSAQVEVAGWLVGLDSGTVGRSHSAAPLSHESPRTALLPVIAGHYRAAGLPAIFRLPVIDAFEPVRAALRDRGFAGSKRTLVQVGSVDAMAALADGHGVGIEPSPTAGWGDVFLGEGFDPVDGASRLAILRRATSSVFASIESDGRVAAVGSACFSHGWCGVHGMRTAPAYRGRGMASRILAALAAQAHGRGISRVYLQVEAENAKAQALYRRGGFQTAWAYEYWKA